MERRTKSPNPAEQLVLEIVHRSSGLDMETIPLSQTDKIVHTVLGVLREVNHAALTPHLPEISIEQAASRIASSMLAPLKQISTNNFFGSRWNEITAQAAGEQWMINSTDLRRIIVDTGSRGQKIRKVQADIAREAESAIKRSIFTRSSEGLLFEAAIEAWATQQSEELRRELKTHAPDLSKKETEIITCDVLSALVRIIDFAPRQSINLRNLRATLLKGRLGTVINVIHLHCLPFINSPKGIVVANSAQDVVVENAEGKKLVLSQEDTLAGVAKFAEILRASNISHNIVIFLVDNDKFVMAGQEQTIQEFTSSLEKLLECHSINKSDWSLIRASDVVTPLEFEEEWERKNRRGDSLTEKTVDEEFQRLQSRTLPQDMKTRQFAREIAKKSFLLQVSFGATVPILFEPAIVLQKTKAHQQATKMFDLGAKLVVAQALVIAHWKDRKMLE